MLTQDEAELYDRQIRLWGVNAQSRIRQSKVLMLGFEGIASEVAKILVLAGIDTLTIVDDKNLQESDLTSNLFCRPSENEKFRTYDVKSKLKKLNPLVKVNINNISILDLKPEDYDGYDLVTLHSFLTIDEISIINKICREKNIKFYIVIDYGFFGFMFNDLGKEFKFTYEVFENIDDENNGRASGGEKDPIKIGDDYQNENDDGLASSDEEDNRPKKKKMRVHSPNRESESKSVNDKRTKVGTLSYVPFNDMISSKSHQCTSHTSPILFTSIAMFKFYSQYKHLPKFENYQMTKGDLVKLNELLDSIYSELNISQKVKDKLDSNWYNQISGSFSPICAVLGGVAGQDMIRALSEKDIPINNTFLFDGTTMAGVVDKVGLSNLCQPIKPIVRDFIQFDDDDD